MAPPPKQTNRNPNQFPDDFEDDEADGAHQKKAWKVLPYLPYRYPSSMKFTKILPVVVTAQNKVSERGDHGRAGRVEFGMRVSPLQDAD